MPTAACAFVPALLPQRADSARRLPAADAAPTSSRQGFKFLGERYGWGHAYNAPRLQRFRLRGLPQHGRASCRATPATRPSARRCDRIAFGDGDGRDAAPARSHAAAGRRPGLHPGPRDDGDRPRSTASPTSSTTPPAASYLGARRQACARMALNGVVGDAAGAADVQRHADATSTASPASSASVPDRRHAAAPTPTHPRRLRRAMKITEIRFGMLRVPLKTPFKTALRTVETVEDIVVIGAHRHRPCRLRRGAGHRGDHRRHPRLDHRGDPQVHRAAR